MPQNVRMILYSSGQNTYKNTQTIVCFYFGILLVLFFWLHGRNAHSLVIFRFVVGFSFDLKSFILGPSTASDGKEKCEERETHTHIRNCLLLSYWHK